MNTETRPGPFTQNGVPHLILLPVKSPSHRCAPCRDDALPVFPMMQAMPVPWVEPEDISNVVVFLASDESRYVTGSAFKVDAGAMLKF